MAGKNSTNRQSRKAHDRKLYDMMVQQIDAQLLILVAEYLKDFDSTLAGGLNG